MALVGIGGPVGGETAIYYPGTPQAAPVEAGNDIGLPPVVADERLGTELVYGFLCKKPVEIAQIREQLGQRRSATTYLAPSGGLDLPCDVDMLGFIKCEPDACPQEVGTAAQPAVADRRGFAPPLNGYIVRRTSGG